tara:strand:+ start:1160 stop:1516 length:357 start_codon:yes stop_codon:yes gene_type:complete
MRLAQYSLAAHNQKKYTEMYHYLMKNQTKLSSNPTLALDYAKELGLDMQKFNADADSPEIFNQIVLETEQLTLSNMARIAVPKFLIQGKELQAFGAKRTINDFSRIIEEEIKKLDNSD